jgi:hypothetical protein
MRPKVSEKEVVKPASLALLANSQSMEPCNRS